MDQSKAEVHHTPWMKELDDSLERYLEEEKKEIKKIVI